MRIFARSLCPKVMRSGERLRRYAAVPRKAHDVQDSFVNNL